jgi:hypothetical protein
MFHSRIYSTVLVNLILVGLTNDSVLAQDVKPQNKPGVVILVSGAGGMEFMQWSARWAIEADGLPLTIKEFQWTHGKFRVVRDLQDTRHLLKKADELAELVVQLKKANDQGQIFLMGTSAGTGLILAAAEKFPPATLERIILLSSAVSPQYNLLPALRATKKEIVSFSSDFD